MGKKLIVEIQRYRELMGLRLLSEQPATILDDIVKFAKNFKSELNVVKSEFDIALKALEKHKNGVVRLSDDELVRNYSKLANSYPEVADEIAPKIIQNLDDTLKNKITQLKLDIQDFKDAGATEAEVKNYIDDLFKNGTINSPIDQVETLLKKDLDDFKSVVFGTRQAQSTQKGGFIDVKPSDIPNIGPSELEKLQKLYRAKGLGSLLQPIRKMRQAWSDFFTSSTKLTDETLSLTKSFSSGELTPKQKNDLLKRISSNLENLAKKDTQIFEDYNLWLETYIKPVDYNLYEKIRKTEGFKKANSIFTGTALEEYEKNVLTYSQRRKILSEQIKDVIFPSRWFGKNMLSKLKAAGKDSKISKWEKWGKILNPSSAEFAELRRWLLYGGTRHPQQYIEYGNKLGWLGLGRDLFFSYLKRLLWWNLWISVLDLLTDLVSVPLAESEYDVMDFLKKNYASYQDRAMTKLLDINLESEKDDADMESLLKFMTRMGVNIPIYFKDNLFQLQTVIPGIIDDVAVLVQNMTRKLSPEELENIKLIAKDKKNKAIQQRNEVVNELQQRIEVPLPSELKDTTILNWNQ